MVGAKVDVDLHRRIRITAAERDLTIADYLRTVLDAETPEY